MPTDAITTTFPGPDVLGRNVVVGPGAATPAGFAGARRLRIDADVLAEPAAASAVLRARWLARKRTVIELAVDNDAARRPETTDLPPYRLPRDHAFHREELHFLTWANSYDLRAGEPRWWHGVLAERRTDATSSEVADITLPDGRPAWVDGGPRGPLPAVLPPVPGTGEPPALVHRESIGLGRLTVHGDAAPTEALAPDQLAAVVHAAGPARVIAPAGSSRSS